MNNKILFIFLFMFIHTAAIAKDFSEAYVYPNPWIPGDGLDNTGTLKGITFNNLPMECDIEIYTLTGELVHKMDHNGDYKKVWNGILNSGKDISSGLYIYCLKSESDSKYGVFIIIR